MACRYFSFLIFLVFSLNFSTSYGKPSDTPIWKTHDGKFYHLFSENQKFIVNTVEVPENKLQRVLDTKLFYSKKSALNYIKKQSATIARKSLHFSDLQTELPQEVVWPTQNEWSWEWEKKYNDWIIKNFDAQFFKKYKIQTDCADAAVAIRWIFARIHFLPAAQTLALTGRVFSNESMLSTWGQLPTHENWNEDKRFLAALNYVLENIYTHSLNRDSYPILIDKNTLLMGAHYLLLHEVSGHTMIFREFYKNKRLRVLASDVPRKIRTLTTDTFREFDQPREGRGGILRMRWPIRTTNGFALKPAEKMPYYSLEQYSLEFMTGSHEKEGFADVVHKKLGSILTAQERFQEALDSLISSWKDRVAIVKDGFLFCSQNKCENASEDPEAAANYDNHSTPARDARILVRINEIMNILFLYGEEDPQIVADWEKEQETIVVEIEGHALALRDLLNTWQSWMFSTDPNNPVLLRWGIQKK